MTEQPASTAVIAIPDPAVVPANAPFVTVWRSAYGLGIVVETIDDLLRYLPSPLIPPSTTGDSCARRQIRFAFTQTRSAEGLPLFRVAEEGVLLFSSPDAELAARVLESQIHLSVAALTDDAVFVHAGVVGWKGKAVLIPGPSHSGKSTLVSALVAAGATYYSDEYAVIDEEGRVHSFARDLRLRGSLTRDRRVKLGSEPAEPLRAAWVFDLRYQAGAVWAPKELTPGHTLLTLLANAVAVRRRSEATVRTLRIATTLAQGWSSLRADAAEAAEQILQLLDQTPGGDAASRPAPLGEDIR